ncbi:MAG: GNAT family N-acetyltransferase [Chitinispirillaceae bacterium]
MNIDIRNERHEDHRAVEELTREAFWNLYVPGCDEHYLVHIMRNHPDFIPTLDFVAVLDDKIVGNIMYTKSYVIDRDNNRLETITFGPVSVLPEYQRKGIGSALIRHSSDIAHQNGFKAIIIEGHPYNYVKHGFKSSIDFSISDADGRYPFSLLVLELEKGFFSGAGWRYVRSDAYDIDTKAAEEYDKTFPHKAKEYRYTQEDFSISSRAFME